jgi:hypothetical protein
VTQKNNQKVKKDDEKVLTGNIKKVYNIITNEIRNGEIKYD